MDRHSLTELVYEYGGWIVLALLLSAGGSCIGNYQRLETNTQLRRIANALEGE